MESEPINETDGTENIQEEQVEEPKIKYFPVHASGETVEAAEENLASRVQEYRTELKIDLSGEPETQYSVNLFKGESMKRSALAGVGKTYHEALDACVEDFGVDPDDFNKEVRIKAMYCLSDEEAEVVREKTTSAGPMGKEKCLDEYLI